MRAELPSALRAAPIARTAASRQLCGSEPSPLDTSPFSAPFCSACNWDVPTRRIHRFANPIDMVKEVMANEPTATEQPSSSPQGKDCSKYKSEAARAYCQKS